jgi:hypothetical protein
MDYRNAIKVKVNAIDKAIALAVATMPANGPMTLVPLIDNTTTTVLGHVVINPLDLDN